MGNPDNTRQRAHVESAPESNVNKAPNSARDLDDTDGGYGWVCVARMLCSDHGQYVGGKRSEFPGLRTSAIRWDV